MLTLRQWQTAMLICFDVAMWVLAVSSAVVLRMQELSDIRWQPTLLVGVVIAAVYLVAGMAPRLHEGRARLASLDEMLLIGTVAAVAGSLVFAVNLVAIDVPRSVPAIATLCFVVLACWGRATVRRLAERRAENVRRGRGASEPVVLVGAGEAARELISSMLRDPDGRWQPVAMVDDDPRKRHLRIRGVPVSGSTHELRGVVGRHQVRTVILAMPSAGQALVREISSVASELRVDLKVLPASTELISGRVGVRDVRDLNLTDVLGRNQLDTDIDGIAGYLTGRRILVTGAGGSIGSELCRQISRFSPEQLIMLDRDESALHAVQLSLSGRALLDDDGVVLCDIRDVATLTRIFEDRRPEVVFHAAALKHLPMLEQYPAEAVKTNVIGTRNVLDASRAAGVERFVNISTDKAANPVSVLGYSKRLAERITASYAALAPDMTSVSVRFGNVLGSRGSVLTAFASQIANGGPLTVTHPDVTRYFMTIEEACQLVVQAGAIGSSREALVLDMGEAVRILDVAHQLIEMHGEHVRIEFTGLRQGEKLEEELFGDDEPRSVRTVHPLINHVPVPDVALDELDLLPDAGHAHVVTSALARLSQGEVSVLA
ncbi:nucleoside-diphosphate sugar epimerase/dehydratase [Nocardioides bigeumensis]|uniref:Nucleoside-diphosphate sugar epimerase/dehydratase n=1 Tax=Nocardioides bigeumensis TaxID=433657 RepID=A0ABP5K4N1_9ACTN